MSAHLDLTPDKPWQFLKAKHLAKQIILASASLKIYIQQKHYPAAFVASISR